MVRVWALPDVVAPVTVSQRVTAGSEYRGLKTRLLTRAPGFPGQRATALTASTEPAAPPSMDTVAIPQTLHLRPIQITARY